MSLKSLIDESREATLARHLELGNELCHGGQMGVLLRYWSSCEMRSVDRHFVLMSQVRWWKLRSGAGANANAVYGEVTASSTVRPLPAFLRFLAAGSASALVYYLLYQGIRQLLPYLIAHGLALLMTMLVAYLLNCHCTFRVRPNLRGLVLYPLSNLAGFAISAPALYLLVEHLGVSQFFAPALAQGIATPLTFLVARMVLVGTAPVR